jgi:MYXO-CTERM domain-containing protein
MISVPDGVLGHWGIDTAGATHYAWAVVDPGTITGSDNQFAVTPEAGSLGLLGLGMLGLFRRRR